MIIPKVAHLAAPESELGTIVSRRMFVPSPAWIQRVHEAVWAANKALVVLARVRVRVKSGVVNVPESVTRWASISSVDAAYDARD